MKWLIVYRTGVVSSGTTGKPTVVGYTKNDIIMVTPSYMLNIADEFERQGLDPAASSLHVGGARGRW